MAPLLLPRIASGLHLSMADRNITLTLCCARRRLAATAVKGGRERAWCQITTHVYSVSLEWKLSRFFLLCLSSSQVYILCLCFPPHSSPSAGVQYGAKSHFLDIYYITLRALHHVARLETNDFSYESFVTFQMPEDVTSAFCCNRITHVIINVVPRSSVWPRVLPSKYSV